MSRSRNTAWRKTTGCPRGRGCGVCRGDLMIAHRAVRADEWTAAGFEDAAEADRLPYYPELAPWCCQCGADGPCDCWPVCEHDDQPTPLRVSLAEFQRIMGLVANPPAPNERLRRAMRGRNGR